MERVRLDLPFDSRMAFLNPQRMAAALSNPDCSVWDLELDNGVELDLVEMVSQALERQGSTLLKLTLPIFQTHCERLEQALCSANCRLQHLHLDFEKYGVNHRIPRVENTSITSIWLFHSRSLDTRELLNHGITCLLISAPLFYMDWGPVLLDRLQSGSCRLRHVHRFRVSLPFQRKIIDWLENNPGTNCIEVLELENWESPTLEEYCAKILERNKRYRDGGLLNEDQVDVSTAKLFMCGHTGMGKTTITRNLVRTVPLGLPACLQRHRSTYGIDLHPLTFRNGQQLLVCDLAGQHEYHSFHHYFVRGSDKDIFAIVCRGPSPHGHQGFKNELHYWLRFIAAHRGVSSEKLPSVIIVLNYFPDSDRGVAAEDRCKDLVDSYKGVIHFASVVGLVGTSYRDVQSLKKMLGTALANLLNTNRPTIPKLSEKFLKAKKTIQKTLGEQGSAAELASLKEEAGLAGIDDALIQLCLLQLHDMGELLFLERQQGEHVSKNIGKQLVILDFQWFVRDVIGIFVPRLSRTSEISQKRPPSSMEVGDAKLKLKKISHDEEHTEYLMDVLQTMGVLIIDAQNVKVLALLTEEFKAWPEQPRAQNEQTAVRYWGRRFSCRDQEVTLLPSAIFAMLQVRIGNIFCRRVAVGNGWIHAVRNFVDVVVKIGGKTCDWHDRHWINVLLRFQHDRIDVANDILREVKQAIVDICSAVHWGCPALQLDEWVIDPEAVKIIDEIDSCEDLDKIETLLNEVQKEGSLSSGHTWEKRLGCTSFEELLTPDEQRECKEKYLEWELQKLASISKLEVEVEDLIKTADGEGSPSSGETTTSFTPAERKLFELLLETNLISKEILCVATETLHEVKYVKKKIQDKVDRIQSLLLLKFDACLPKYLYISRSENIFRTLFPEQVAGSRWTIKFLCEYGDCHEVEGQKGIVHTEMSRLLRKCAPVLIPALRQLFFAGKLAATGALGQNILPSAEPFFKELKRAAFGPVLGNLFKSIDQSLSTVELKEQHSRQEHEQFCSKLLEGRNIEEELGLYKAVAVDTTKWVCYAHKLRLQRR